MGIPVGAFSHSANYYVVYPGNTPENHPPLQKRALSIQNSIGAAEFRTLGPVATGGGKQRFFFVFRTARAQRMVRPQCATTTSFLCVTRFHQRAVVVKEKGPVAPPNNDVATRSSNGSGQGKAGQ